MSNLTTAVLRNNTNVIHDLLDHKSMQFDSLTIFAWKFFLCDCRRYYRMVHLHLSNISNVTKLKNTGEEMYIACTSNDESTIIIAEARCFPSLHLSRKQ
jgi:hypothetical protein